MANKDFFHPGYMLLFRSDPVVDRLFNPKSDREKESEMKKPNCYKCISRGTIPGDAHSCCKNPKAEVTGDDYGIKSGWFNHPHNFDPVWLKSCTGFFERAGKK